MRARPTLLALAVALTACWEMPPGNVPLSTAGEEVEILTEIPSADIYESFQELTVEAIGMSGREATVTARHMLRNRGAELHARFVSVDDATATLAWDFSGRTIMTIRGRAFRVKEDPVPTRTFEPAPSPPPPSASAPAPSGSAPSPSASPAPSASAPKPPARPRQPSKGP